MNERPGRVGRAALLIACQLAIGTALYAQSPATVIQGARVFTGDEVLDSATVVIRGRTIESVTSGVDIPAAAEADAVIVEAQGMTLLPGLIDSHTHNFGPSPQQALNFGVTTVLDMLTDANMARQWRRQQAAGTASDRADVIAGGGVTVDGGHGTQFGISLPTLDDPEQTEAVHRRPRGRGGGLHQGDLRGGRDRRSPIPTHAASTLPRIVAAAHSHDLLAVFHISTIEECPFEAIAAGADGLVHIFYDSAGSDDAVQALHVRRRLRRSHTGRHRGRRGQWRRQRTGGRSTDRPLPHARSARQPGPRLRPRAFPKCPGTRDPEHVAPSIRGRRADPGGLRRTEPGHDPRSERSPRTRAPGRPPA